MVVRIEGQHDRRHEDDVELEVEHLLVDTTKSIDEISSRHDCSRRARMGRRASAAASGAHRRSRVAGDIAAAAASNDASHGDGGEENEGACRWRLTLRQALRRGLARAWRRGGIFALSFLILFYITWLAYTTRGTTQGGTPNLLTMVLGRADGWILHE